MQLEIVSVVAYLLPITSCEAQPILASTPLTIRINDITDDITDDIRLCIQENKKAGLEL